MAATYDFIPVSVPSFFRDVVTKVSNNLKYTLSDDVFGVPIQFKHGSWVEIERQLLELSQSSTKKNFKYPLVLLIHPINEKLNKPRNASSVTCDVLIVVDSTIDKSIDDREKYSFKQYLYPIYSELLTQILDHRFYFNYSIPNHQKKDLYHIGQESANGMQKYKLPDALDGLALLNLELDLRLIDVNSEDACNDTSCPNGREIDFLNYIASVDVVADGGTMMVRINDAYYEDSSSVTIPDYVLYEADTSEAHVVSIGEGHMLDMSAKDDAIYQLQVMCADAFVTIVYTMRGGVITEYTKNIRQTITPNLDCSTAPNYLAMLDYSCELNGGDILSYTVDNTGVNITSGSGSGSTLSLIQSMAIDNTLRDFYIYCDSNLTEFENHSFIKLKCI